MSGRINLDNISEDFKSYLQGIDLQLEQKMNYLDLYENKDIAIAVGYSRNNTKAGLFVTYDGINISRVGEFDNFPRSRWDFGVIFLDGYFYICYDYIDNNFNGYNELDSSVFLGGNKIGVARTKDFIKFEHWDLNIPLEFKQTFSPKFFIDNDKKYITLVMSKCDEFTNDYRGIRGYKKYCYIIECNDNFKTASTPILVDLTDNSGLNGSCKLDPYIIKKDDKYNLFIKEEDNDYIQQYTSFSLLEDYSLLNEFKNYGRFEAPCVYYFNNEYLLFKYDHEVRYNVVMKSTDLVNWSEPFVCDIYSDTNIMNASFFVCDNETTKKIVYEYIKGKGAKPFIDDYTKNFGYKMFNQSQQIKKSCDIIAIPNTLYYIKGTTNATINLDVSKMFIGDKIYLQILSGNDNAKLTLKQNSRIYFNGTHGDLVLDKKYMNDILTLTCINRSRECVLSGIYESDKYSSDIEEQGFRDDTTGLNVVFYKNNKTVNVVIASSFTKKVSSNTAHVTSFIVPEKFRPIKYAFNSYLLGDGQYNNIKIDANGRMEIIVSREVVPNSTWFECSMTYLTRN